MRTGTAISFPIKPAVRAIAEAAYGNDQAKYQAVSRSFQIIFANCAMTTADADGPN